MSVPCSDASGQSATSSDMSCRADHRARAAAVWHLAQSALSRQQHPPHAGRRHSQARLKVTCCSHAQTSDISYNNNTCTVGQTCNHTAERRLSNTIRHGDLSFEEGRLASKARKRVGLKLAPHSMVNSGDITLDGLHKAYLTTIPTAGRKRGSVELASGVAPPGPTEHAMIEAAIQMALITPEQAEALVEKGRTLEEWLVEQEKNKPAKTGEVRQKMVDALGVLALVLFNLVVLVGLGWIVLRILRSL